MPALHEEQRNALRTNGPRQTDPGVYQEEIVPPVSVVTASWINAEQSNKLCFIYEK